MSSIYNRLLKSAIDSTSDESSTTSSDSETEEIMIHHLATTAMLADEGSTSTMGSIKRRITIHRDIVQGHNRLYADYFAENSIFPEDMFRTRIRMNRDLFFRIQRELETHEPYFVQKRNAANKLGLSSLQKMTAALQILCYGSSADSVDEYIRIGASTALESLKVFCKTIVDVFGEQYLRSPSREDLQRLLAENASRGFPGMIWSIDCMHWMWKNCLTAWKGMYKGHIHKPTIILEAVTSYDLWIWHACFGLPGSLNDINVLDQPTVFQGLMEGRAPSVRYSVNGNEYNMGYYLADGIYPRWVTFVKSIPLPQSNKHRHFASKQEAARKDVERAFGVLQARFRIVGGPARYYSQNTLRYIMFTYIILHNMIVENERHLHQQLPSASPYEEYDHVVSDAPVTVARDRTNELQEFLNRHIDMRNKEVHSQLQSDLIEHNWNIYINS